MTAPAQKLSALALALAVCLWPPPSVRAQNEPEAAPTQIEAPQAEPTEFTPVTAGEANRAASATTADASPSSGAAATPENAAASPEATASTSVQAAASKDSSSDSSARPKKRSGSKATGAGKGAGPAAIVPENSPFASMNFANSKVPTNINSDTMNLDYKNKAILFNGHVHAVQGAGDLTSDTLRVQYGQDFNDIKMMYADGNVRMSQGTRWVTADHAVLDQSQHLLTFHGNPVVHDQKDQITGSLITVDMVTGKSTVQNPRVVIFPREEKNADNVTATDNP
jgi:lipopolysaccharide transport protein LptA